MGNGYVAMCTRDGWLGAGELLFLYFFLFLWVNFSLLDPDPATQINADPCGSGSGYGSGSETLKKTMPVPGKTQLSATWVPYQSIRKKQDIETA
jgi:hypothetical protein